MFFLVKQHQWHRRRRKGTELHPQRNVLLCSDQFRLSPPPHCSLNHRGELRTGIEASMF